MKKIVTFLIFFMVALQSFAYINIHPTTFDRAIDDGDGSTSFYLTNATNTPVAYRIFLESTGAEKDMTDWIEFYPKSVKLGVGESKEIKMQITAPKGVKKGEYTSNFVIKEIENPLQRKEKSGAKLKIYTELKIELAGYVGDVKPEFKIENFKIRDGKLEGIIKNIGEIRSSVELYLSDGKDEDYLGKVRLLAGGEKQLSEFKLTKDEKKYKKIIVRDLEGKVLISMEVKDSQ